MSRPWIVLIADENYVHGLAVTLSSLLRSVTRSRSTSSDSACSSALCVCVLDAGLSSDSVSKLEHMVAGYAGSAVELRVLEAAAYLGSSGTPPTPASSTGSTLVPCWQLPGCDSYSGRTCWLKLLLHQLLPSEVDCALYLDCDVLVLDNPLSLVHDARRLFAERAGALVAAVQDFGCPWGHSGFFGALQTWQQEGRTASSSKAGGTAPAYFNAGVLVLNLPAWRAREQLVQGVLLRFGFRALQVHGSPSLASLPAPLRLPFADQDALNLMAAGGGWVQLDPTWNVQGIGTYLADRIRPSATPDRPPLFTRQIAASLEAAPSTVHFTGPPTIAPWQLLSPHVLPPSKPWAGVCLNPFRAAWLAELDATPWTGWRPQQCVLEQAAADELLEVGRLLLHRDDEGAAEEDGRLACHVSIAGGFELRSFLLHVGELCRAAAAEL